MPGNAFNETNMEENGSPSRIPPPNNCQRLLSPSEVLRKKENPTNTTPLFMELTALKQKWVFYQMP